MRKGMLLACVATAALLHASTGSAQVQKEIQPGDIFQGASPAVVRITAFDAAKKPVAQGSGFFISRTGVLVTSYEPLRRAVTARVFLTDKRNLEVTGMLAALPACDLALLHIDTKGADVPALTVGIGRPKPNAPAYFVGRPLQLENTFSQGLVRRVVPAEAVVRLHLTQKFFPGTGGGPVMDRFGRVMGVASTGMTGRGPGIAVGIEHVHALTARAAAVQPLPAAPKPKPAVPPGPFPEPNKGPLTPDLVFKRAAATVVRVDVFDDAGRLVDQGSGCFIRKDGWLLTSYHLVKHAHAAKVALDDKKTHPVKGMLAWMPAHDLVLLKVDSKEDVPALGLGTALLKRRNHVFVVGTPAGQDKTFSQGTISRVRAERGITKYETSIDIRPDQTGGPLLNDWGNITGVTSLHLSGHHRNVSVAVKHVHELLERVGELAKLPGIGKPPAVPAKLPKPTPTNILAPDLIFKRSSPAVVRVDVFDRNRRPLAQGSGFFVHKNGLLVTNYHVVKEGASARVRFDDKRDLPVKGMVAALPKLDLALLRVDVGAKDVPVLLVEPKKPVVGAPAYAIGTPVGLTNTFSQGIVSGVRNKGSAVLIQTTASITHGSSGGPLMSQFGHVIGVTSSGMGEANLNFAVAGEHVHTLIAKAGPLKPLPGAPASARAPLAPPGPRDDAEVTVYTSLKSIRDVMPEDTWPRYDGASRAHDQLSGDLRDKWVQKHLLGARLRVTGLKWANASYEKSYRVYAGHGRWRTINTPLLLVRLTDREPGPGGTTSYIDVICGLEHPTALKNAEKAMDITAQKRGSRVSIDGRIVAMLVKKGNGTQRSRKWHGVRRASRRIQLVGDPKTGTNFIDRRAVDVLIAVEDWHVPARSLDEIAGRKPKTDDDDKPDTPLTDEQRAARKLKAARLFISGIPQNPAMKQKAVSILEEIIEEFPKTPAAEKARKELEKLRN